MKPLLPLLVLLICSFALATNAIGRDSAAKTKTAAKFAPPQGKILHGAGQSPEYFDRYCKALDDKTQPCIFMYYTPLFQGERALTHDRFLQYLKDYPHAMPQIGISMGNEGGMRDGEVAAGEHDAAIQEWAELLIAIDRPVFVRIGYECNGKHNGYHVESYADAFRRIVDHWRVAGVTNIATVWCMTGGCGSSLDECLKWYPGDEYVDWWAWDHFAGKAPTPCAAAFMKEAEKRGKPVMIGECTPRGHDTHDGEKVWKAWYEPYFKMLRDYPVIQATCYINWDWEAVNAKAWKGWGNACIDNHPLILKHYQQELRDPRYIHAGKDVFTLLGYSSEMK